MDTRRRRSPVNIGYFFPESFPSSWSSWMSPELLLLCQSPQPGPYVKEMSDAATFYTNRVLKDYKET